MGLCVTDPPYHDDVQYSELSLPLRAWADLSTEPYPGEAAVNPSEKGQAPDAYEQVLTEVFSEIHRVLKPQGHLVFSYANRSPQAWADLFSALDAAGLRAVGFTVVHSENETDSAKRGVRACTLDMVLDLVRADGRPVEFWQPPDLANSDEARFVSRIGETFKRVGGLTADWRRPFIEGLENEAFLR